MEEKLLQLNKLVADYGREMAEYEEYRRTQSIETTQKKIVKVSAAYFAILMFVQGNFDVKK